MVSMPNSEKVLKVLSIERDSVSSHTVLPLFERLRHRLKIKSIYNLESLKSELLTDSWSIIITDYDLGSFTAFEAMDVVKNYQSETPVILLTDAIGEELVADMMKAGITDMVLNSRIERIVPVIKRIIREADTREKELKAQRVANEALASKEQMLAIVSHDIKNPLSAIQLEAQMLLKAAERSGKSLLAEEVKIQANRILKTSDRMKVLISDLLDKNKNETGLSRVSKEEVIVAKLVQDVLDSIRPLILEKEIIIRLHINESSAMTVDRNKMFQVFSNLISNAIKFTPPCGSIVLKMDEDLNEHSFVIEDSGPGIQDQELTKIFEKYWTGRETECTGTGLGLFICKTIIEAHNGHISVENIPGKGARFKFQIPKITRMVRSLTTSFDNRKRIFIIDDDKDLSEVISWVLGKEGYSIHSFTCPFEAIEYLKYGDDFPHLLLVDFHMNGMKGNEFVASKNLISGLRDCPVMMISASPDEVKGSLSEDDVAEVITKPIDLEGLVISIQKTISERTYYSKSENEASMHSSHASAFFQPSSLL